MDELALINWSPKEEQWAKINIIDFDFTPTLNAFLRGFFNWSFHDFKCQIRGNAKVTKCQFLCLALPFFFWTTYQLYSAWTLPYSKLFFFSPFVAHYFATYLKYLIIHIFIIIIVLNKGNQTSWIASGSCGSLLPHKLLSFWHNLSTAIHKTHKCPTEPLG